MLWKCEFGHQWSTTYDKVSSGRWCHICGKTKRYSLEDAIKISNERGGKCLSTKYANKRTLMKWECSEGHIWCENFHTIKSGKWCPACNYRRITTIYECKEYAISKGGFCLTQEYKDCTTKMKWKCSCGYIWNSTFGNLKHNDGWCPKCSKRSRKTIKDAQEIAKSHGGKCLSDTIESHKSKLLWECSCGFQWKASFNSVHNYKSWCPKCKKYKSQNKLFSIINNLFDGFTVHYNFLGFDWLKNKRNMEIDIFVEEIGLAIEYDGIQHFKPVEFFGGQEKFKYQQKMDKLKNNIISSHSKDIPYFIRFNYKDKLTPELVLAKLISKGVPISTATYQKST